ncbi:hypothetical protein [Campylobacter cuniculorum]|uniref:Uncharacterized protein n=2 Tax=Campylobacter cuniculorum TaxID=374106 RepID=A0A1W6BWW1_9BACT|nr:hypothetical protein [Campylobacter cuniculorum]ARJ56565.1 hypothetical protein CCUN_0958 [Campylobacter cuniculorum DSM 23162 = LMG 24588]QOR04044.1 hypothetical protein A0071_07720 [Campylobacter cuniculorum]
MIFLIPLLLIIAVIFGIDYFYFNDQTDKKEYKIEHNSSLEKQKQDYIENLFKQK